MQRARPTAVLEYDFRQRFRVPAARAYAWAVDYSPADWKIAGGAGQRAVRWLGPELVELTDSGPDPSGRRVTKTRLVHLYPKERRWVSSHIGGPRIHSQFRYSIRSAGARSSELHFRGRELRWDRSYTASERREIVRALRAEDVELWRRFARAMEADCGTRRRERPPR